MKSKTGDWCSYKTAQVSHGDRRRKKSKTGEDGSYHTAQVGPGSRGWKKCKKMEWIGFGFNFGLRLEFSKISRNVLAHPVMGTIFLVYIYICVCLSWSKKRRRNYVGQTRACSKSVLGGKIRPMTPVLFILTIRWSSFSMDDWETFTLKWET